MFAVKKDLNISFSDIIKIVAGKMEIDSLQKETSPETNTPVLDITQEKEVLEPTLEPKEEKEKKTSKEKKPFKLPLNRRNPPRNATLTPKKYIDVTSDSSTYSSVSSEEEADGTVSKSDSFTASEDRLDTPDSDDLDFIAGSGSLSEEDSEAEFEGDELSSYSSSTISSKDSSSSSSDFDSEELLSDDLSL